MLSVTSSELKEIIITGQLTRPEGNLNFLVDNLFYDGKQAVLLDDLEVSENFGVHFDTAISHSIAINNLVTQYSFSLNATIHGSLQIKGGIFKALMIQATVDQYVWVNGGVAQQFSLGICQFKHLHIYNFTTDTLELMNVTCQDLSLEGGKFNSVKLIGPQNDFGAIRLFGGDFKEFLMSYGKVETLLIRRNVPSSSVIALENIRINTLQIIGTTNYGKLYINQLEPVGSNPTVDIDSSIVGNLDIISTDLSLFKVFIQNSKLVDLFYTNTSFPDTIHIKEGSEKEKLRQLIGINEQLSVVATKRGDKYNTVRFQALSLDSMLKTLPRYTTDWWMLYIYKVSNNFRLNWLQGVAFTLAVSLLFYIPFVMLIEDQISWGWYGWQNTWNAFKYVLSYRMEQFFEFLNPLHKIDYFTGENKQAGFGAYLVDYIGRTFVGFGIYQTVQAFRKYGKSGD